MDSYTDVSGQCCGCGCGRGQRHTTANTCPDNGCGFAVQPEYPDMSTVPWSTWDCDIQTPYEPFSRTQHPQRGSMSCTQTSPGCLEQQFPVAMAYVPWQQWQTTYALERGLLQGTIFPELDLEFIYGRCGR